MARDLHSRTLYSNVHSGKTSNRAVKNKEAKCRDAKTHQAVLQRGNDQKASDRKAEGLQSTKQNDKDQRIARIDSSMAERIAVLVLLSVIYPSVFVIQTCLMNIIPVHPTEASTSSRMRRSSAPSPKTPTYGYELRSITPCDDDKGCRHKTKLFRSTTAPDENGAALPFPLGAESWDNLARLRQACSEVEHHLNVAKVRRCNENSDNPWDALL
ncbi:hypothetical protein BDW60DRAFT_219215 [Aspergillus nidulans var. acristatus]